MNIYYIIKYASSPHNPLSSKAIEGETAWRFIPSPTLLEILWYKRELKNIKKEATLFKKSDFRTKS
jgi:hypothetical protein